MGDVTKYWRIYFDNGTIENQAPLGGGVTLDCPCKEQREGATEAGKCKPSLQKTGDNCYCIDCIVDANCMTCGDLKISSGSVPRSTQQFILIKAVNLELMQ